MVIVWSQKCRYNNNDDIVMIEMNFNEFNNINSWYVKKLVCSWLEHGNYNQWVSTIAQIELFTS